MTVVIPDIPGASQSDPILTGVKVDVKAANTPPTAIDQAEVSSLSPNNTGLPVNLPAIVQKASAVSASNVTTLAKAFTSNNAAGNSIIVVCGAGNNGTLSVTDTAGNTYQSAVVQANSTTFEAQIFWASGILAGANTVTVTNGGAAASMALQIYEVSGLIAQAGSVLDQTASGTGTSAAPSVANITPATANELAFMAVAVGTAAQAVSATSGTFWTLDSTQNSGGTPSGLFTFGSLNLPIGNLSYVTPKATLAGSEPYAMAVASFRPVTLGVAGVVTEGSPYPQGATPITADSGNVAAATATATLAAVAGKTTYIAGYQITSSGSTAASVVTGTVTGVVTGTLHFTYASVAGVTLTNQPLIVPLPYPIPASAANTTIAVALPSLGSGNTNTTVSAYGFQL